MSYPVKQDVYEGPLELLLELISQQRLDPAEVSISTITDEYLQAVAALGELDLDRATKFLVLAATLLELKSLKLLPAKEGSNEDLAALLEERDHLLHRLIEYSTFKEAAAFLDASLAANQSYLYRKAEVPPELVAPPEPLPELSARLLAAAAKRALAERKAPSVDVAHVTPITISVGEAVAMLIRRLERSGTLTFDAICRDAFSRIHVVVRFLALLEMFKDRSIELEQDEPFGEIVVRHRQPVSGASR